MPLADQRAMVDRFAAALDADDFVTLEPLMAPDCWYMIRADTHVGPAAIVASYRQGSSPARELFETVVFSHRAPVRLQGGTFRIDFVDELRAHAGSDCAVMV